MKITQIKKHLWELKTDAGLVFFLETKKECLRKLEEITGAK